MADRDEVIARHKAERKELLAQCQKLKHGVPKGDKKKKKEVNEQVARMEAELDARHEQELKSLGSSQNQEVDSAAEALSHLSAEAAGGDVEDDDGQATSQQGQQKKLSKAQKRREKKSVKDQERNARINEAAIENLKGPRHLENVKLKSLLLERGLKVFEIHADGNCMYNAVKHQLGLRGILETNESLRIKTAQVMRSKPDDYLPFLTHPETGDLYTPEQFDEYCKELASTTAWGGHLELRALSEALTTPMEVLQAVGPMVHVGEQYPGSPITLVYHRHALGLGEHYNSVAVRTDDDEEEKEEESNR